MTQTQLLDTDRMKREIDLPADYTDDDPRLSDLWPERSR